MAKIRAKQIDPTGLVVGVAAFVPTAVLEGNPMTVPAGFQWPVAVDELMVDDELTLDGELVLL